MFPFQNTLELNALINNIAGNNTCQTGDYEKVGLPDDARKAFRAQLDVIVEEVGELYTALVDHNLDQIRDGLADTIVVLDGMRHRVGFPSEAHCRLQHHNSEESTREEVMLNSPLSAFAYFLDNSNSTFKQIRDRIDDTNCILAAEISFYSQAAVNVYLLVDVLARKLGIDILADQQSVYESNLSKFDTNRSDAESTAKKYEALGVQVEIITFVHILNDTTYFVVKSTKDQQVAGKFYPKGKFLKSAVTYREPQWAPLSNPTLAQTAFEEDKAHV